MVAVTWTLVGLLAATLGLLATALFRLESRIEALGARMEGRIDALGARMDGRIDSLSARVDAQGARIDRLSQQVAELTMELRAHLQRHAG